MKKVSAPFHLPERLRCLGHDAQRDLAGEIEGRGEDVRNDRTDLAVKAGEGDQLFAPVDHFEIIGDQRAETCAQSDLFLSLAVQQRHLLAIFAQPGQRKAEIGLSFCRANIILVSGRPIRWVMPVPVPA